MTRVALGLKWGCFGASGWGAGGGFVAPKALSAPSNDASAIEPRPTPHCWRNPRRAKRFAPWPRQKRDWQRIRLLMPNGHCPITTHKARMTNDEIRKNVE